MSGREIPVVLVLLAAGDSKRFECNKLLYQFYGKEMYRHIVDEIETVSVFEERYIVTQYEEIKQQMKHSTYHIVENKHSEWGISYSIYLALQVIENRYTTKEVAVCFCVCDQPNLKASSIEAMITGWRQSNKGIGCMAYQDKCGNPVVFHKKYVKELMELTNDVGGRVLLRKYPKDVYRYQVAKEQLEDKDYLKDTE